MQSDTVADSRTDDTPRDFLREIIDRDLREGTYGGRVATRFPPEPNGYLHIGHAKSICLNFGIAQQYDGTCNLRFDDTNPTKEEQEFVDSITRDVQWLGFDVGGVLFASDYFERMYELAEHLIRDGKAYVDSLDEAQIREYRGTLSEPGTPSPYRDRSVDENLDLFRRMRAGEFADGAHVLRAKIDMAARNMKMRDPLLYRIRHAHHHRTGDAWCIYPMYDYAHPLEDAFENITHSLCTLEFIDNREIYDWVVRETAPHRNAPTDPKQYEFARLALDYTIMSKRKLAQLVSEGHVSGWDDPRMPTISAMRRRGYTPEAIRRFCELIGVAKNNSTVDIGKLEFAVRDDLNFRAPRVMCVLDPLEVELTNFPAEVEQLDAPYFPADVGKPGSRAVPMSGRLYIERDDFSTDPPKGYRRLAPGRVVRLRYGYCIRCDEIVEQDGQVVKLRCSYLPDTRGGGSPEGEKVWGVIHWVSADHALSAEVRVYDRLFTVAKPDAGGDFLEYLNPASLEVIASARIEPSVANDDADTRYQFERQGYFYRDPVDSAPGRLVFNRIVTLRDSWAGKSDSANAEPAAPVEAKKSPRSKTRPQRRSKAEYRAEARNRDPGLAQRYARYQADLGLSEEDADVLTGDAAVADVFEAALAAHGAAASVAKWVINELPRALGDRAPANVPALGSRLGELVALVDDGAVSATAARDVLASMMTDQRAPAALIEERGLGQVTDASALAPIVEQVLAGAADKVEQYRGGKTGLMGFFVGQVMKASGGKADPKQVRELLESKLS